MLIGICITQCSTPPSGIAKEGLGGHVLSNFQKADQYTLIEQSIEMCHSEQSSVVIVPAQ